MAMRAPVVFAVLLLLLCSCEPLEAGVGLLEPHADGVISQASLNGGLLDSPPDPGAAGPGPETVADPAAEPETVADPAAEPETVADPAAEPETVADPAAEPETVAEPAAEPEPEPEAAAPEAALDAPSADPDATSSEVAPSDPSAVELPDELSSGQYGGGTLILQQRAPAPAGESPAAAAEDPSESQTPQEVPSATELPAGEPEPMALPTDEFGPPPTAVATARGGIDLASVLPPGPVSDQEALDVLASLPRLAPAGRPPAAAPCAPGQAGLLGIPLSQLSMVRAWLDGTLLRAELRGPGGRLYTVVRGDRVGSDGGRVLQVSSSELLIGEIGFGLDGSPFIVQEAIRQRP
jgi:hypothetical protein